MPIRGKIPPFILLCLGRMNNILISHLKNGHQIPLPRGRKNTGPAVLGDKDLTNCVTSLNSLVDVSDESKHLYGLLPGIVSSPPSSNPVNWIGRDDIFIFISRMRN